MPIPAPIPATPLEALIVGAGPAGLVATRALAKATGGSVLCVDKTCIGGHIQQYPTFMRFFSTSANLELDGFPLASAEEKPTRREYLTYLAAYARYHDLPVRPYCTLLGPAEPARDADGRHRVQLQDADGRTAVVSARRLVLAVGAWESPRRLGVPGEDLPHVHRRFAETHPYIGRHVLVVGGANSAVETALTLWRGGARVSLCHRGAAIDDRTIKYWMQPDIVNRLRSGEITGHLEHVVEKIEPGSAMLRHLPSARTVRIECDVVMPMIGYDPPSAFLKLFGVQLDPHTQRPVHDPRTLETNVPGIHIAGVLTEGNVSGRVFIENLRHHGQLLTEALL